MFVYAIVGVIVGILLLLIGYRLYRIIHGRHLSNAQVHAKRVFAESHANHLRGNFVKVLSSPISDDYDLFLDQEIGRGACAMVVIAQSANSSDQYAVKIVEKSGMDLGRIEREISLLKDVDHPNIIRLFRVYDSPKRVYFVMELCAGGHLGNLLTRQQPKKHLDEAWARLLTRQLVSAIAHIHERGIAHRDIKLQNILMDSSNDRNAQLKLIDFGYSARYVGALPMRTKCGTPYTTAPEVLRECYDERCDVWSVGVCVYIMLCGKKPFDNLVIEGPLAEAGKTAMITNILAGRYSLKEPAFQNLSKECISFVTTLLNKDYRARVRSADVLQLPWLTMPMAHQKGSISATPSHAVLTSEKSHFAFKNLAKSASRNDLQRTGAMALVFGYQPRQAVNMRSLFQSCDLDGSGALTFDEFKTAITTILPNLTNEDCIKIFQSIDVNGDQQVTYTEFLAATIDPGSVDVEHLNKAFQMLDEDKNGYITADELRKVLTVKAAALDAEGDALVTQPKRVGGLSNAVTAFASRNSVKSDEQYKNVAKRMAAAENMKTILQAESPRPGTTNISESGKAGQLGTIDDRVQAIVEAFDINNDGVISYEEFLMAMTGASDLISSSKSTGSVGLVKKTSNAPSPKPAYLPDVVNSTVANSIEPSGKSTRGIVTGKDKVATGSSAESTPRSQRSLPPKEESAVAMNKSANYKESRLYSHVRVPATIDSKENSEIGSDQLEINAMVNSALRSASGQSTMIWSKGILVNTNNLPPKSIVNLQQSPQAALSLAKGNSQPILVAKSQPTNLISQSTRVTPSKTSVARLNLSLLELQELESDV